MENDSQKEGLVGIFDILGYQYIIDNNQINYVADLISNILLPLPQRAADKILEIFRGHKIGDYYSSAIKDAQWRIFSDTILLLYPFTHKEKVRLTTLDYFFFLDHVSLLLRSAFDAGLPLRGAIDYGEFYIKENCFAGKSIINSYRLSQQLQISGCALTESLEKRYFAHIESDRPFKEAKFLFVLPYLVPLKENSRKTLYVINWLCPFPAWEVPPDLRQYVAEKFYAHNKDIPREALPKLENTEMTLRYFLSKREKE
jgi:hypothetical protein